MLISLVRMTLRNCECRIVMRYSRLDVIENVLARLHKVFHVGVAGYGVHEVKFRRSGLGDAREEELESHG